MSNSKDNKRLTPVIGERLVNGILKENPTFVLLLGMCPTLAVTTSAINGFGMGATTLVVLALSNMMISALRKIIPDKIRIPAFIVIIASFVTIVELLLNAYIPSLYEALGLYIPLIVVNCIILGRAEAYAYSNPVIPSLFDGIGMGIGFTAALTIIGAFREILGNGSVFGARIMPAGFVPVSIFVMAPGAFFVLAMLTAIQNAIKIAGTKRGKDMSKIQSGCGGNCLECGKDCKVELVSDDSSTETEEENAAEEETVSSENGNENAGEAVTEAKNEDASDVTEDKQENVDVASDEAKEDSTEETSENADDETSEIGSATEETETIADSEIDSESEKEADEPSISEEDEASETKVTEASESTTETSESQAETSEESEASIDSEEVNKAEAAQSESELSEPAIKSETSDNADDEIELIDMSEIKKPAKTAKNNKKTGRKKTSMAKAKEMLSKADENVKEGKKHD